MNLILISLFFYRHVTHVSCNDIVAQTTQELARLTEVVRRGNKQQKLQSERLREEFSEAVTNYGRAQKVIFCRL